jgi:putative FmdB family regulatory protein
MPIYEFECCACGTQIEELIGLAEIRSMNPDQLDLSTIHVKCPECSGTLFKKMLSSHSRMNSNWHSWNKPKNAV